MAPLGNLHVRLPRSVPPGKLGLLVLAAAIVPVLATEAVKKIKERREGTRPKSQQPKTDVNDPVARREDSTSTTQAQAAEAAETAPTPEPSGTTENAASPTARAEAEAIMAAEMDGAQAPPAPSTPKRTTKKKAPEPDQPMNPKRTRNSRPS